MLFTWTLGFLDSRQDLILSSDSRSFIRCDYVMLNGINLMNLDIQTMQCLNEYTDRHELKLNESKTQHRNCLRQTYFKHKPGYCLRNQTQKTRTYIL